jgi:hypothetical protein
MIYKQAMRIYPARSWRAQWMVTYDKTSEYDDVEKWYLWMSSQNGNTQIRMHTENQRILRIVEYSEELQNEWIMYMVK